MMNKIMKRLIAGFTAALMAVSAVGSVSVVDSNAEEAEKWGSSAGFTDLQQDTRIDTATNEKLYNTNYGLHTDKTVSHSYEDGRTYDLNLESWYIGENPVDVGLILDASGSMAWPTNKLYPLDVQGVLSKKDKSVIGELADKYGVDSLSAENLRKIQDNNGGYLPEDILNQIMDPGETDNSKLGYDDYLYYVYEARSSVSEFVPLGYWDGGKDTIDDSMLGHYTFDNTLKNEAGTSAKLIARVEQGEAFSEEEILPTPASVAFAHNGLNLSETDKNGNVLIDLSGELDADEEITISFDLYLETIVGKMVPQSPILYFGDGTTSNYLALERGRSNTGTGASTSLKLLDKGNDTTVVDKKIDGNYGKWIRCSLKISTVEGKKTATFTFNGTAASPIDISSSFGDQLVLVLGGNEILPHGDLKIDENTYIDPSNLQGNYIKNLSISGKSKEDEEFSSTFTLADESGLTDNNGMTMKYTKQLTETETAFDLDKLATKDVSAVYDADKKTLNLTQTAKSAAVMLDAKPKDDTYTLVFKILKTNKNGSDNKKENKVAELLYLGSTDTKDHQFRFTRNWKVSDSNGINDDRHFRMYDLSKEETIDYGSPDSTLESILESSGEKWHTVTISVDGTTLSLYDDDGTGDKNFATKTVDPNASPYIILAGIEDEYAGNDIYIDDMYVFDSAFTADQVKAFYNIISGSLATETCGQYHAQTIEGEDIAQIDKALATNLFNRRGWYYVNSHSTWKDITGCLESGKQYIGIAPETDGDPFVNKSGTATVPVLYTKDEEKEITDGDDASRSYEYPAQEQSIRFYIDNAGNLRCFCYAGGVSAENDVRTFCSVIYANDPDLTKSTADDPVGKSEIKYQTLNGALNQFFTGLYEKSDATKVSAVRFSTTNLLTKSKIDSKTHAETATPNPEALKDLVMLKWTEENQENVVTPPKYGDTSAGTDSEGQHNYVMTGGTYTWTGLRSFYENIHNTEIKEDQRDKYIILFTDGRDNTNANADKTDYCTLYAPEGVTVKQDGDLAKAWADKLKEEGYTIYCVMLATGSVSKNNPETKSTYDEAVKFLGELAGKAGDDKTSSYVLISDPNDPSTALDKQFEIILNSISSSLNDYTVQDYIDPRFDLVDKDGNVVYLGAGGKVTCNGKVTTVGNFISDQKAECFSYIPKEGSENVYGKEASLYYDDEKDMYYLCWTVSAIGGGSRPFDTSSVSAEYLEDSGIQTDSNGVKTQIPGRWYSTITVRAKNDFIGGNAILTNGNEAGMNLVYKADLLYKKDTQGKVERDGDGNPVYLSPDEIRDVLEESSGTSKSQDRDADGNDTGIDSPAKGFPRTTVNVRLQKLYTKNLNDVVYLGEIISPTMMLADLQDGYMTGSYYLEYLERYAYRLYGSDADETPLIELLNQWLGINEDEKTEKTFTVPYIYLPEPEYDEVGKIKEGVIGNNTGGYIDGKADFEDSNLKDVVGYLTYTWTRLDPDTDEKYEMEAGKSVVDEFIVTDTKRIKYNLQLRFTPLHEASDNVEFALGSDFIKEGEKFFKIEDGEFVTSDKWEFTNRDEYLKALISDESNGAGTDVYEWNLNYKPTQGTVQVDKEGYNADKSFYGNAAISGESLTADTIYTKDVVNGALALELLVKGSDLKGGKIGLDNKFTFTALRNYKSENEPLPYDPTRSLGANAVNQEYKLTFEVGKIPKDGEIEDEEFYTIWAELTDVQVSGSGSDIWTDDVLDAHFLPIGTYTIELDTAGWEADQFLIKTGTPDVRFKNLNVDTFDENYEYSLFPDKVVIESASRLTFDKDPEYTIWDGTTDQSDVNIAEARDGSNKLTFYLGTKPGDTRGDSLRDVKPGETVDNEYVKDRLGIIQLSYGDGRLALSKEVTNSSNEDTLTYAWKFDIELTVPDDMAANFEASQPYTLIWQTLDGDPITAGHESDVNISFEKDESVTDANVYRATVSVKHGEKVIISGLPNGIDYKVSENRAKQEGYKDEYQYKIFINDTDAERFETEGKITTGTKVDFINQFLKINLPGAGGTGAKKIIRLGCILMLAGLALFLAYRRKESQVRRE